MSINKGQLQDSTGVILHPETDSGQVLVGASTLDATLATLATLVSPVLTGIPQAPTATVGTNTTQIATTSFVTNAISSSTAGNADKLDGQHGSYYAPVASPTFTGNVTVPSMILTGDIVNDGNERHFRATGTNINWGFYVNGGQFGGYDWQNSRSVFQYLPSTSVLNLMVNGGSVATKNNTLDDGYGTVITTGHVYIKGTDTTDKALGFYKADGTTQTGRLRVKTDGSMILSGGQQAMYFRPNGDTTNTGQAILDTSGKLTLTGGLSTVNNTLDDGSGNIIGTGTITSKIGQVTSLNPNDANSYLTLGWTSDNNPRLRVGGTGTGSYGILKIQGVGDVDRLTVDSLGNTIATGVVQGTQLNSTVTTGTMPLNVASTTLVTNLNADLLDGMNASSSNMASTIVARDASGNFSAGTITAALSGNASTATKLATAVTINGVSFDGSASITVADSTKGCFVVGSTLPVVASRNSNNIYFLVTG